MPDKTFHNIPNEEYHHGKEWGPMLGSTRIKALFETPAKFQYLSENPIKTTLAMKIGTAVHTAVFEPDKFPNEVAAAPECDRRTKVGKEIFEQFQNENAAKLILKPDEYQTVIDMAAAVHGHSEAVRHLDMTPIREQSIQWFDETFQAMCKARPDAFGYKALKGGANLILDLKTTAKNANTFRFAAMDFGYPISAGWYLRGMKKITKQSCRFRFIAVEKEPPHLVSMHELDEHSEITIDNAIEAAGRLFRTCTEAQSWPGWSQDVRAIELTDSVATRMTQFIQSN